MSHDLGTYHHPQQNQWKVTPDWKWTPKLIFTIVLTVASFVSVSAYVYVTQFSKEPELKISQAANGRVFYVAPNGSDNNSGSESQPWKTVKFAIQFQGLQPGDTILVRGGDYTEGEIVLNGDSPQGANGEYLTLKNYPGEEPVFHDTFFRFQDQDYIHIEGFTFTDVRVVSIGASSRLRPVTGLRIINNTFVNTDVVPKPDTTHIRVSTVAGQNSPPTSYVRYKDVLIQNNTINENNTNIPDDKADALQIGGNVDYLRIIGNKLFKTTSIGITIAGRPWHNTNNYPADPDDLNPRQADYVLVKENIVDGVNANAIYLDAPGSNIIVEDNLTARSTNGIQIAGEGVTSGMSYEHILVRRNVSINNSINFVIGGRSSAHHSTGNPTVSCDEVVQAKQVVYAHNTMYSSKNVAFNMRFQCADQFRFKNNIIATVHSDNERNKHYNLATSFINFSNWHLDSNLFYSGSSEKKFDWLTIHNSLPLFRAATQFEVNSIQANPDFRDIPADNFELSANSPAIDTAKALTIATNSQQNSSQLHVADASYFTDGFEVTDGDWIRIGTGTDAPKRQVVAVNYATNTLTLHQPASWQLNAAVQYDYAHAGPDYGAFEKDYQTPTAPPAVTPVPSVIPTTLPSPQPTVIPTSIPSPIPSPPATLPPTSSGKTYTAAQTATAPVINGDLSEFAQAPTFTVTSPSGTSGTYALLWDTQALYVGATVTDTNLFATQQVRDGSIWSDDSLEFVLDTGNEHSSTRDTNDYKYILNILNVIRDEQQVFAEWNGAAQTAAIAVGSVGKSGDSDVGYRLELKIPWQDMNIVAQAQMPMGMDMGLNDATSASSRSQGYWSNSDGGSINQPNGWGALVLGNQVLNEPQPTGTIRYEAELADHGDSIGLGTSTVSAEHGGFSGSGFIDMSDYPSGRGSFITWTFTAPSAGLYTLDVGYALAADENRALTLLVNNTEVDRLRPPTTGAWRNWGTISYPVELRAGINTVTLEARLSMGGPNIDYMQITKN